MQHNGISFELLTDNGSRITEYKYEGRSYIEGRKGSSYKLRIFNNNHRRVLAVPTVDGLSVLDGKRADYNSSGYVLQPYETLIVEGWRTSLKDVREFIFTRSGQSYSNKSGQGTDNLGVIGLAVFNEKKAALTITYPEYPTYPYPDHPIQPWTWNIADDGHKSFIGNMTTGEVGSKQTYGSSLSANKAGFDLEANSCRDRGSRTKGVSKPRVGTGMGEKTQSHAVKTSFDRVNRPFASMQFFYYERKQLEQMGIIKHKVRKESGRPNPFPSQPNPSEFCKEV